MTDDKLAELVRDLNHPDRVTGHDRAQLQFVTHAELLRRGGHWDWLGIRYSAAPDGTIQRSPPW